MATNKHAVIRYHALDKCFRNAYKRYYIEDLIAACNEAIAEFDGSCSGIQRRQVFDDISYMKSEQGWCAPISSVRDGRRTYYRYDDPQFSISNQPLSENDLAQLKGAVSILSRFKGMPQFGWMEEMTTALEDKLNLSSNNASVISLESNPYLVGVERLSDIFHFIINRQVILVKYGSFNKDEYVWTIHPYFLKQYNNRWYLLGLNDSTRSLTTLAIDRILDIKIIHAEYIPTDINIEEYFDDVIGVTIPKHSTIESILLKFSAHRFPYVISKPLHHSQTIVDNTNRIVRINVVPNNELIALLLSFGCDVTVLSPSSIKQQIHDIILEEMHNYETVQNDCTE